MGMDFKRATEELLDTLSHEELAKSLGVSVPSIRQARLESGARAFRKPPEGWEIKVSRLAQQRAERLLRLSKELQKTKSTRQKSR
jgi:hypothetical protein